VIVADGTSCRHQIADGSGRQARHVMEVLAEALHNGERAADQPSTLRERV
jgi:hypothetical protein